MPEAGATATPALLEELFDAFNRHDVDGDHGLLLE